MPNAQMLPMNAVPNAAIGILHQEPMAPTSMPAPSSAACFPPLSPAAMACAAATPGGRKNFGVEQSVQQIAIQKHGQGDADEHRHHQIRPAHEKGNRNRQQQAVGSAESC